MKKMKNKIIFIILALFICMKSMPMDIDSFAYYKETDDNEYIKQKNIPTGKTGKVMSVTFTFYNNSGKDLKDVEVAFSSDVVSGDDDVDNSTTGYVYPFETGTDTNYGSNSKKIGDIKAGASKSVSLNARVKRNLSDGYYCAPVRMCDSTGWAASDEYVNVWIKKVTTSESESDTSTANVSFVLGEGQEAPRGSYPNVMNYSLNLRNNGKYTAYDVTASMVLDSDSTKFPFNINEANYDRHFDSISYDQIVELPYSMSIRSDSYTGYYPINIKITYRESSEGELKSQDMQYFVYVTSKTKPEDVKDFNANDRTKARIVVDSYYTDPAEVYAGQDFTLYVKMKNASTDISASNLLFTFTPEKVSDNPVFSTDNGSNSVVVNSLAAGATADISLGFVAKAGIDQRSYTMTIKEKFDSPEFKNAEESVEIDIPVKQIARLNVGTIDIVPDTINVGDESNITFPINNTGKVILYNVMATFEDDTIVTNSAYVGNIKPGETGNVDIMLVGALPTTDDNNIKITISYEDENGNESSVEKELMLTVSEPIDDSIYEDIDIAPVETKKWYTNMGIMIPAFIAIVAIVIIILFIRKKKREHEKKFNADN